MTKEHAYKLREMIVKASVSLNDTDALQSIELFDLWKTATTYSENDRRRYNGKLYKCKQAHQSQSDWTPDVSPSLWEEVAEPGQGDTPENPIHYNNNMELIKDKYYVQNDVIYLCFRDSDIAVYNDLSDLIGIYVYVYVTEN